MMIYFFFFQISLPDEEGQIAWFSVLFVSATTTLIACQILSFRSVFTFACYPLLQNIAVYIVKVLYCHWQNWRNFDWPRARNTLYSEY